MFLLIGGILCAIIGLVGLLNFFNAMMDRRLYVQLEAGDLGSGRIQTIDSSAITTASVR